MQAAGATAAAAAAAAPTSSLSAEEHRTFLRLIRLPSIPVPSRCGPTPLPPYVRARPNDARVALGASAAMLGAQPT